MNRKAMPIRALRKVYDKNNPQKGLFVRHVNQQFQKIFDPSRFLQPFFYCCFLLKLIAWEASIVFTNKCFSMRRHLMIYASETNLHVTCPFFHAG